MQRAAAILRAGGLVAFPTETVYGLGAAARDPRRVARLYAVKGRPADHPVIVHLASAERPRRLGRRGPARRARARGRASGRARSRSSCAARPGVPDAVTGGRDDDRAARPRPAARARAAARLRRRDRGAERQPLRRRLADDRRARAREPRRRRRPDPRRRAVRRRRRVDDRRPQRPGRAAAAAGGRRRRSRSWRRRSAPPRSPTPGPARAPGMLAAHYAPRARVELCADGAALAARASALLAAGERTVGAILPARRRRRRCRRERHGPRPPAGRRRLRARPLRAAARRPTSAGSRRCSSSRRTPPASASRCATGSPARPPPADARDTDAVSGDERERLRAGARARRDHRRGLLAAWASRSGCARRASTDVAVLEKAARGRRHVAREHLPRRRLRRPLPPLLAVVRAEPGLVAHVLPGRGDPGLPRRALRTARACGRCIRFGHEVTGADWDEARAALADPDEPRAAHRAGARLRARPAARARAARRPGPRHVPGHRVPLGRPGTTTTT